MSPRFARRLGQLGAHYNRMTSTLQDLPPNPVDPDCEEYDAMLADTLHKRRPSDAPHPLLSSPRCPTRAAFTDRAARLREGRGAKAVLVKDGHERTDWAKHSGSCVCDVCHPFEKHQAGSASHDVSYNKVVPCAKDSPPTRFDEVAKTYDSTSLSRTMSLPVGTGSLCSSNTDQLFFSQTLGRKKRDLTPRSWVNDDSQAAGRFNQDFRPEIMACSAKGRQVFQGTGKDLLTPRSGVVMALSPRGDDPPAPTSICSHPRADGAFKAGLSAEAAAYHIHINQKVFRYDASITTPRGRIPGPGYYDDQGAGLTSQEFQVRYERQQPDSPKQTPRALVYRKSDSMLGVMDHQTSARLFAKETETRQRTDVPYINLCRQTSQHLTAQRALSKEVKEVCGTRVSVMPHLAWHS